MNEEMKPTAEARIDSCAVAPDDTAECSFLSPEERIEDAPVAEVAADSAVLAAEPVPPAPYVFDKHEKKRAKKIVSRTFLSVFFYWIIIQGAALILSLLCGVIIGAMFGESGIEFLSSGSFAMILQLVCYGIALPIFFAITKNIPRAQTPKKNKLPFGQFMIFLLIAWATMIIGSYLSSLTDIALTYMYDLPVNNAVDSFISDTPLWLVTVVVVIVGPIVEELIFRKVMIDRLSIFGDRTAIVISAIAFGLFHGNLSQLFYATLVGLLFGYVYARTRRIWNSIFLHMIVNFLGSVIPMIGQWAVDNMNSIGNGLTELTPQQQSLYALSETVALATTAIQSGVFIAGLVFLIIYLAKRKFKVSHSCEIPIPRRARAGVFLANPGVILFLVICAISIAASLGMIIISY